MERAYIVSMIDSYHAVVRIPTINKSELAPGATPDNELATAIISAQPGTQVELKEGDIVIVEFESQDIDKPVIVGCLFNQNSTSSTDKNTINNLVVQNEAKLPEETSIGNTTSSSLKLLEGLEMNENLQSWVDRVNETLESTIDQLSVIEEKLDRYTTILENIETTAN